MEVTFEKQEPLYKQLKDCCRNMVLKVHDFFSNEKRCIEASGAIPVDFKKVQERTAVACGISVTSVQNYLRLQRNTGKFFVGGLE